MHLIFANINPDYLMKIKNLLMAMASLFVASPLFAQDPIVINLYANDKAPHDNGDTAIIYVYPAPEKTATGRSVLICPGGGYTHLAMDHEGKAWAPFFNNLGITAVVLQYRMPKGDLRVPIADAERALAYMRANAHEWRVNIDDIGIMGSSAGGHLASTIATNGKVGNIPSFQILFYPVITMDPGFTHRGTHDNFLGKHPSKKQEQKYSSDLQVSHNTPRAFIALSDDDSGVLPANGVNYYVELYRHDVPASLHVYPTGGHGWGMRESFPYHVEMELELKAWLKSF